MVQLLIYGKLAGCPTYRQNDVTPDLVQTLVTRPPKKLPMDLRVLLETHAYVSMRPESAHFWHLLVEPLRAPGHAALAAAAALFMGSLLLRTIDNAVCPALLTGTHFLWRLLNGMVLYIVTRTYLLAAAGGKT